MWYNKLVTRPSIQSIIEPADQWYTSSRRTKISDLSPPWQVLAARWVCLVLWVEVIPETFLVVLSPFPSNQLIVLFLFRCRRFRKRSEKQTSLLMQGKRSIFRVEKTLWGTSHINLVTRTNSDAGQPVKMLYSVFLWQSFLCFTEDTS